MSGFIQGEDRFQATLFPERIDDYVAEDSSVRVIDILTNSPPHHEFFVYIKDEYRKELPVEPESL